MFRCSLASCLLVFIVCSFCGKDFKSLGRHVWRCKEKGKLNNKDKNNNARVTSNGENTIPMAATCVELPSSITSTMKCSCGKVCNGRRGLKMHHAETFEIQCNEEYLPANEVPPSVIDDQVLTKVGVKLPKSIDQWKVANDYFQASLPIHDIASSGLNTTINRMNKIIYEYFEINCGLVNSVKATEINNKYK